MSFRLDHGRFRLYQDLHPNDESSQVELRRRFPQASAFDCRSDGWFCCASLREKRCCDTPYRLISSYRRKVIQRQDALRNGDDPPVNFGVPIRRLCVAFCLYEFIMLPQLRKDLGEGILQFFSCRVTSEASTNCKLQSSEDSKRLHPLRECKQRRAETESSVEKALISDGLDGLWVPFRAWTPGLKNPS